MKDLVVVVADRDTEQAISALLIPIARAEFTIAPLLKVPPRFARGTAWGAWVRFPLQAGGTLRRGFQFRLFL